MKVKDFIKVLEKLDGEKPLEIAVQVWTKRYPVAYVDVEPNDYGGLQSNGVSYRIACDLPSDEESYMTVVTRKR